MNISKELQQVQSWWEEFETRSFPQGNRSVKCAGQTITLVQSEVSGYILSYLQTKGSLSTRQRTVLTDLLTKIEEAMNEFTDEGKQYFTQLKMIAEVVLETAHDQPQ